MDSFNKRWNIPEVSNFQGFKNVMNFLLQKKQSHSSNIETGTLVIEGHREFGASFQESIELFLIEFGETANAFSTESNIYKSLKNEEIVSIYFQKLEKAIVWIKRHKGLDVSNLITWINIYLHEFYMQVNLKEIEGNYYFFPKFDEPFDNGIVNEALDILTDSPRKHFIDALQFFQKQEFHTSSNSLRRCLEEFFKMHGSESNLDNNIIDVLKKLKDEKIDDKFRGIIKTIDIIQGNLSLLEKSFNKTSKHANGNIGEHELEFLIYFTGMTIKYMSNKFPTI